MTLRELKTGQSAVIESVGGEGATRQHFLDMGVIPGAEVTLIKYAPMGDPMELRIHGYELTLRLSEAEKIGIKTDKKMVVDTVVRKNAEREKEAAALRDKPERSKSKKSNHPGLGEGGIFHEKSTEKPLPENTVLTFALAGNQNSGKTTLFNQLTGSNQHVGNFPGVTVDRKSGALKVRWTFVQRGPEWQRRPANNLELRI